MSVHTILLREPAAAVIARMRTEAQRMGAIVTGDDRAGTIAARAPGGMDAEVAYAVAGETLELTVVKKPPFVPDALISAAIAQFFGNDAVR